MNYAYYRLMHYIGTYRKVGNPLCNDATRRNINLEPELIYGFLIDLFAYIVVNIFIGRMLVYRYKQWPF